VNSVTLGCPATVSFLLHCHVSCRAYEPQSMVSSESATILMECGAIEPDDRPGAENIYRTTPLGAAWVQLLCNTPVPQTAFVDSHGNLIKPQ